MSEIKVNKISPRTNCGTVTVGDSGDSVSVTSGVPVTVNGDLKSNALKATDGGVIISQSGTNITIGASGDTISLASGASQSGFGRTGTVNWDTTAKTGDFTATNGSGFFVNTTSGTITVTLPSSPSAGDIVALSDYAQTWDTNAVTVNRNSSKIQGNSANCTLSGEGKAVTFIYVDSTRGWIVVNSGNQSDAGFAQYVAATGGNAISTCGDFKTHIFTSPGTFTVSCAGNSTGSNTLEYLVVGSGGGGGHDQGGGGGAGGFRSFSSTPGTNSPLNAPAGLTAIAQAYPITVGGGGAAKSKGNTSTFDSITSEGGGFGGSYPSPENGGPGGSGGGAGYRDGSGPGAHIGGTGNSPPVTPAQGKNGGPISGPGAGSYGAGGGGAAIAGSEDVSTGGCGSFVTTTFIGPVAPSYGEPQASPPPAPRTTGRYFAGGGGGRPISHPNSGGVGGGGNGSACSSCSPGVANTGGGGGFGYDSGPTVGTGGSGIVMIRYKFQ